MAIFDTTTRSGFGADMQTVRFPGFFGMMVATVAAWNDARATREALSKLTDRELEDIGLLRGDIDLVAEGKLVR